MRLFIAIQFDQAVTDALEKLQEDMRAQGVKGRFTRPENLHLTLAFIGEYGHPDQVLDAMEQAGFAPFSLRLDGVGTFGDLFWAGISDSEELKKLVKRLRRELSAQGIPFDRKRFSPHITLIRQAACKTGRLPAPAPPAAEMLVTGISLMRSDRGRNGMIYTEIGRVE